MNLEGLINLKFLKILEHDIRTNIKTEKNRIKVLQDTITNNERIIKNAERNIKVIFTDHNKHKRMVCDKCAYKFFNKEQFKTHKCQLSRWGGIYNDHIDRNLRRYLCDKEEASEDIYWKQKDINKIEKNLEKYNQIMSEITDLIIKLSKICNKCNQQNLIVKNVKCDYNHNICSQCLDTSKCPICIQELCFICMNVTPRLETISCNKKHTICYDCFNKITGIYNRN